MDTTKFTLLLAMASLCLAIPARDKSNDKMKEVAEDKLRMKENNDKPSNDKLQTSDSYGVGLFLPSSYLSKGLSSSSYGSGSGYGHGHSLKSGYGYGGSSYGSYGHGGHGHGHGHGLPLGVAIAHPFHGQHPAPFPLKYPLPPLPPMYHHPTLSLYELLAAAGYLHPYSHHLKGPSGLGDLGFGHGYPDSHHSLGPYSEYLH